MKEFDTPNSPQIKLRALAVKGKTLTSRNTLAMLRVANHMDRQAIALQRTLDAYRQEFFLMDDFRKRCQTLAAQVNAAQVNAEMAVQE